MEISDDTIDEIIELYDRAHEEHKSTKEPEYWQGRKDGLRLALSLLQPDQQIWNALNKSSWGFRNEDWAIVKEFMKDARYNIADALVSIQDKKPLHPFTRINLIQWLSQYDFLAKKGITLPVNDAVDCTDGFRWKRR